MLKNSSVKNAGRSTTSLALITVGIIVIVVLSGYSLSILLSSSSTTITRSQTFSSSETSESSSTASTSSSSSSISTSSSAVASSLSNGFNAEVTSESTSAPLQNSNSTTSNSAISSNSSIAGVGGWLTYHAGNSRDGYDDQFPNIGSPSLSWSAEVDAPVFAEPLYYDGHVYIATENNTVYALNATIGAIAWSTHLGTPADSLAPPFECNNSSAQAPDIQPTIGITGTPVIDPNSSTIYVASLINGTGFVLFALSTASGHQQWNSSITASGFYYLPEEQRGALTLANGLIYVPFGGYSWDCVPPGPVGWIIAMSLNGTGEKYAYHQPTTTEADFWTPEGQSVDSSGFVFAVSGNSDNQSFDFGNSVIKFDPNLSFAYSPTNYFAATNWEYTNTNDLDLDTTGATLLPDNLIFSIGKDGVGYLLNASDLGGIGGQIFSAAICGYYSSWGGTAFAQGTIYVPCNNGTDALSLQLTGSHPSFVSLWNATGFWAGPPIVAGNAVWTVNILNGTIYALSPSNGSILLRPRQEMASSF